MQDSGSDTIRYRNDLETLLQTMKNELDSFGQAVIVPVTGQDSLDEYLLELNSFYYESFHRRFFPLYEQIIKQDICNLYNLGKQESSLKKNIITNLKQQARLFNRIKIISAIIKRKQQETQTLWLEYQSGNDKRSAALLYILKELANGWSSVLSVTQNLQVLLEDKKLLNALNQYPVHAAAIDMILDWNPNNSKSERDFKRLLIDWQTAVKLLVKLQENPAAEAGSFDLVINELRKTDTSWDNRKVSPPVRIWYQQYIKEFFNLGIDSLNLGEEKQDLKHIANIAGHFANWLTSLLAVIEQAMFYKSRGWDYLLKQIHLLSRADQDYIKEIGDYASRVLQSIEELTTSLSSSQANYQYHSQRSMGLLSANGQYLKQQLDGGLVSGGIVLASYMEELRNQISLLESRLELLDEKEAQSICASDQYQAIIHSLDSYLQLLQDVRDEVKRMLSPRTIKNSFPGIDLRIEHLAIAAGSMWASQYNYLIDEMAVGTEIADVPEGRILYEEGDIYIIHLDDITEAEIPKIIVAKKG